MIQLHANVIVSMHSLAYIAIITTPIINITNNIVGVLSDVDVILELLSRVEVICGVTKIKFHITKSIIY